MFTDWHALGETSVFYRKWQVYDFNWKGEDGKPIDLTNCQICGSSLGGCLALFNTLSHSKKFFIFSSAGVKLSEVVWDDQKKLAGLGWSDQEQLIIVLEDGNVLVYDIQGKLVQSFLLMEVLSNTYITECHFWGNGVVAMASDMQLYVYEGLSSMDANLNSRKYILRSGLAPDRPPTSMAIIPPLCSRSGLLEVILGTQENSVLVVDENEVEDQLLHDRIGAPISKMAVAPNGRFLACYRKDGILTVLSATFTSKVLDFDTKSVSRPLDIAWCGEDAVLLLWKNTGIVMVGPYGDWLNFSYDEDVHLIPESDCCRIVTSTSCEILQRVPASTEAIKRIGSTDPAALLYDAMEAFDEGDPKSDENIRSIAASNQLVEAVAACISAAAAEFDIPKQQAYMKAASYGKAFCIDADPTEFVETAKKLRVLNAVRRSEIGIPLTLSQYNRLTPEVLVNRLTHRSHHFLALKICELLKLKNERVLIHWACEKVKKMASQNSTDEIIRDMIKKKLEVYNRISYLDVANAAYLMGRRRLATMILDMEQQAADQVPLLLSMHEEELALQKAINSEDTDLIYLTLMHLEKSRPDQEAFYRLIHSHAEAANLLKIYYRNRMTSSDKTKLHSLLMFGRNYLEAGTATITQAYLQNFESSKSQLMREAASLFGLGRDLTFHKAITEEHIELLEFQKSLVMRFEKKFVDLSLSETLRNLVLLSIDRPEPMIEQEIGKLVKKFKVSEKMFWHIRVQCYGEKGQWNLLAKLANEKKSPIGYKVFATTCIKYKQANSETEKYIEKVVALEDKYDLYVEIQQWRKACDVAIKLKDGARLQEVHRSCKDRDLERQIQEVIARL